MMSFIRWTIAFCFLLSVAGLAFSQSTNSGDIRGTVTDPSGALLPGVSVTVTNLDTGAKKELVTNSDGLYDTASILPGNYQVTFTKQGFGKLSRGPITLQVGITTVNGELKVGRIADGLRMDRRLVRLQPDNATAHYNLACSLALSKRNTDALRSLRQAVRLGYQDFDWMTHDPDLQGLRRIPGFGALVAQLKPQV